MGLIKKMQKKVISKAKYSLNDLRHLSGSIDPQINTAKGSCILVYHGIDQQGYRKYNTRFISQKHLTSHLRTFQKYFDIVRVQDIVEGNIDKDRFSVALTFDDGYLNNLTYAVPVLQAFQVPATFCVTGISQTAVPVLWTDLLDVAAREIRKPLLFQGQYFHANKKYPWSNFAYINPQGIELKFLAGKTGQQDKELLIEQIIPHIDWQKWERRWPYWKQMNPAQIQELARMSGMEIASHGYYHNHLGEIGEAETAWEMQTSKEYLENIIQTPVEMLAYPAGSYNEFSLKKAQDLGYRYQLGAGVNYNGGTSTSMGFHDRFTINPYISTYNQIRAIINRHY